MGQKVNPHGLRVGIINDWESRWYAEGDFADNLNEDYKIRQFLKKKLYSAGVSKIEISRAAGRVKVTVHTAKPGIVIGKQGAGLKKVGTQARIDMEEFFQKKVFLRIYVKVDPDWRENRKELRKFGYEE